MLWETAAGELITIYRTFKSQIGDKGTLTKGNTHRVRVVGQKNMVMALTGPRTKNDCAGEGQQQCTRT
jgi:hypothetical protein